MPMDEAHVEVQQAPRPEFTREQKFGYAVVIACGVLAVTFGMFYMVKHVKAPFIVSYTGSKLLTGDDAKAAEVAAQKAADTDGDTVSDYDEQNIYGSSPYLKDTDSDGMDDNVEIANNMDPACAKGAACEDKSDAIRDGSSIDEGMVGDIQATTSADATAAALKLEQVTAMLNALTPEEIRTALLDAGADKAQLDVMTDDQVLAIYQDMVSELGATGELEGLLQQVQGAQTITATDDGVTTESSTSGETQAPTP